MLLVLLIFVTMLGFGAAFAKSYEVKANRLENEDRLVAIQKRLLALDERDKADANKTPEELEADMAKRKAIRKQQRARQRRR